MKMTVVQHGDTITMNLSLDAAERLGLQAGQEFTIIEMTGGYKLVPFCPKLDRQLTLAHEVLLEQAEVLRALAKL